MHENNERTDIWTFVELLRHRISYGYTYYYIFPQKKPEKNNEIAKYYKSHLKKYQRTYRRHVLGLRNYFYMYFQGIGIVLATKGRVDPSLQHIEQFLQEIIFYRTIKQNFLHKTIAVR